MTFPSSSSPTNKTRYTRVPVKIKAEYSFKKNKGECEITDISEGGIGIDANQIFVPGDLIQIKATLSVKNNIKIDFWCVVRNVQGKKIGLEFEEISNQQKGQLQTYVYGLLDANNQSHTEHYR